MTTDAIRLSFLREPFLHLGIRDPGPFPDHLPFPNKYRHQAAKILHKAQRKTLEYHHIYPSPDFFHHKRKEMFRKEKIAGIVFDLHKPLVEE